MTITKEEIEKIDAYFALITKLCNLESENKKLLAERDSEQQANIDLHQRLLKAEEEVSDLKKIQGISDAGYRKLMADFNTERRWKEAYREVGIKNWKMWCGEYERATDQKPMVPNELKKESEDAVDAEAKRLFEEGKPDPLK